MRNTEKISVEGIDERPIIQDRQCTYNITLWHVDITMLAREMQQCILCLYHNVS